MKLLVFGSLNIDYVYKVDHFVQASETLSSLDLQTFCGGKGLNQSIAFARSGVDTWHAGAVGKNDSKMLLDYLAAANVHLDFVMKKDMPSGHAIIQNTPDGGNCILIFGGANQTISKEEADEVLSHFGEGDYLMLQNEINQIPYIMEKAHAAGMKIILNPSPMDEKVLQMPLQYVDYFILNEIEGQMICMPDQKIREDIDGEELIDALTEKYPEAKIILTLGSRGAIYGCGKERAAQPVFPVKPVDTTAAGDTFTGYCLGSIMQGKDTKEALKIAAKAASIAVTRPGAGPSIPLAEEVLSSLE